MAALIPDERCFVLACLIFFLLMKTEQAVSWTSASTYKVMEPHWARLVVQFFSSIAWFVEEPSAKGMTMPEPWLHLCPKQNIDVTF